MSWRTTMRKRVAIMTTDKAAKHFIFACPYVLRSLAVAIMTSANYTMQPMTTSLIDVTCSLIVSLARVLQPVSPSTIQHMTVTNQVGELQVTVKVLKQGNVRPVVNGANDVLTAGAEHLHALLVVILTVLKTIATITGRNTCWYTGATLEWLQTIPANATSVATADITSMFDKCTHQAIHDTVTIAANLAFRAHPNQGLVVLSTTGHKHTAQWRPAPLLHPTARANHYDLHKILLLSQLISTNTYVQFGGRIFKQVIGVPMGGQASTDLAECLVAISELVHVLSLSPLEAQRFTDVRRRADDVCAFNFKPDELETTLANIYPHPLEAKVSKPGTAGLTDDFLDITINIHPDTNVVTTKHFSKADAFPFTINRLPRLGGATPTSWAHTCLTGQLITLYRACSKRPDFAHSVNRWRSYLTIKRSYSRFKLHKIYTRFAKPLRAINRYRAPIDIGTIRRWR